MNTTVRFGAVTSNIEFGRRDDALEEAGVELMDVAAGDDDEVGAVARLGQGRHDPAGRLHNLEVAVLRLAQGVIDDAARALGERHHRAHAFDIGGEPAEQGQLGLANELGGFLDGLGEIDVLAADLRAGRRAACARSPQPTGCSRY